VKRQYSTGRRPDFTSERGAILIFVGLAVLMLTAFSAFVLDYGVMWLSRRQAQNAADAGALSGAIARMYDETADPPSSNGAAYDAAFNAAQTNEVMGQAPGVVVTWDCPDWLPANARCVRVDAHRDGSNGSNLLPSYFANLIGVTSQRVRATATARLASGAQVRCLLPFAVIDRWDDNNDGFSDPNFAPYDDQATDPSFGASGWSPTDDYEPDDGDVYQGPYADAPWGDNHTGWRVDEDLGRQFILKDGSPGNYSPGWANTVLLPGSIGYNDVGDDILTCNEQPVGIAEYSNACPASDYPNGCIDIQTGVGQGQIRQNVDDLVDLDMGAYWDGDSDSVEGGLGLGLDSPRVRPIAIVDIGHYDTQNGGGCGGSTCVAKIANIVGFFVEGMCNDVMAGPGLDTGMTCDDPNKDVVGRIVTLPKKYVTGVGDITPSASFITVITLVQ